MTIRLQQVIQAIDGVVPCKCSRKIPRKIYQIAAYKLPREQVKTIIFRYVFIYYNRVRIYTRNPLGLPPAKYREWAQAQQAA